MVQWFCVISGRLFDGLMLYWRYWFSVTQILNWNYVGQWPICYGPVIFPYILKTIWWTSVIIGILGPCDAKIYHIKCMRVSDLHFVVQWFWFISWTRFDGGMLDWRYWFSVTLSLTYKYICRSVTYFLWYRDSAIGQWPIFHGPVILPYILKTVWWTSVIIGILGPCDAKIYHIKCMWVSSLYFVVQWFWLISWCFAGRMLDRRYWVSVTLSLTDNCIYRSVTYILWYSDSAIYMYF